MSTKRKHVATGKPRGRPPLDPNRIIRCWGCGLHYPAHLLSRSGLCKGCGYDRAIQAAGEMVDHSGPFYQRWKAQMQYWEEQKARRKANRSV